MSSFTTPLLVEVREDGRNFCVKEEFCYYREEDENSIISVPIGFVTDFASVPRIFWSILPPFGRYSKSAVLHDFLCEEFHQGKRSRKECDAIFLESMKALKVPTITRSVLYGGVRFYAFLKGFK